MANSRFITLLPPEELFQAKSKADLNLGGFEVDYDKFVEQAKTGWHPITPDYFDDDFVGWHYHNNDGDFEGTLQPQACLVTLKHVSPITLAAFLTWYRTFIPQQFTIHCFSDGNPNTVLAVTTGKVVTEKTVLDTFSYIPPA